MKTLDNDAYEKALSEASHLTHTGKPVDLRDLVGKSIKTYLSCVTMDGAASSARCIEGVGGPPSPYPSAA